LSGRSIRLSAERKKSPPAAPARATVSSLEEEEVKKPRVTSRLSSIQAGIAGEYLVAAELSQRGYVASVTLRNTRGIDILASNRDATRSVGIQVKTSQGSQPRWMMTRKAEEDLAENLFYVFVCLPAGSEPASFHIVPRSVVAKFVREGHARWLATPGKHGQAHRDSAVRQFRATEGRYKDRWDLLGLG
jgi:hypothetical protein